MGVTDECTLTEGNPVVALPASTHKEARDAVPTAAALGTLPSSQQTHEVLPAAAPAGAEALAGQASPVGIWTPLAVEAPMRLSEVCPASPQSDVMQLHMVTPDRLA